MIAVATLSPEVITLTMSIVLVILQGAIVWYLRQHGLTLQQISQAAPAPQTPLLRPFDPDEEFIDDSPDPVSFTRLRRRPLSILPEWRIPKDPGVASEGEEHWEGLSGETCIAIVLAGVRGVPLSPFTVYEAGQRTDYMGPATGLQLVLNLAHYHITAHVESPAAFGLWDRLASHARTERPAFVLVTTGEAPAQTRWVVSCRVGLEWTYIETLSGRRLSASRDAAERCYAGQMVVISDNVHYDLRSLLTPL